jgi:pSer/pThr/pTyr-binding forkhead associated (FHA) protein
MLHLVDEMTGRGYPLEQGPIYKIGKGNNNGNEIVVPYSLRNENHDQLMNRYCDIPHIRNISARISRRHCQIILLQSNVIRLFDDSSKNGTFTQMGVSIGEVLIRPGGRFFLGNPEEPGPRELPGYPLRLLEEEHLDGFRQQYAAGNI